MNNIDWGRWLKVIGFCLLIFSIFSVYLFLRRGYFNLYIANKAFGSTSAVVAGMTLVIGPLSKRFLYFARFMSSRRQLGLCAFGLALFHVIVSVSMQKRFPFPDWYFNELVPVLFGAIAVFIWAYMTYISRNSKIEQMGADIWKKRLSITGKLGFLAIFLHLTVMKYEGWLRWFNGQVKGSAELANPSYPPASLFVFFAMLSVIFYRVVNDFIYRNKENGGGA